MNRCLPVSLLSSAAACLMVISGCAGGNLLNWKKTEELVTADARNPVTEVICVWQQAEGRGLDDLPTRGFGGQIFFFTRQSRSPVAVEGDVRIFVFDDQGTPEEQAKPIHQFDFVKGGLKPHLRPTNLGFAYQLFIPYTRKGAHQAVCSLRVRLQPKQGPPVFSQISQITLPGIVKKAPRNGGPNNRAARNKDDFSDLRAPTSALRAPRYPRSGLQTTTIPTGRGQVARSESSKGVGQLQAAPFLTSGRAAQPKIRQVAGLQNAVDEQDDPSGARIRRLEAMVEQLARARKANVSGVNENRSFRGQRPDLDIRPPRSSAPQPDDGPTYQYRLPARDQSRSSNLRAAFNRFADERDRETLSTRGQHPLGNVERPDDVYDESFASPRRKLTPGRQAPTMSMPSGGTVSPFTRRHHPLEAAGTLDERPHLAPGEYTGGQSRMSRHPLETGGWNAGLSNRDELRRQRHPLERGESAAATGDGWWQTDRTDSGDRAFENFSTPFRRSP